MVIWLWALMDSHRLFFFLIHFFFFLSDVLGGSKRGYNGSI
jgi:hypothetical protein